MAAPSNLGEQDIISRFFVSQNEEAYSALFRVFAPRLLGFFRARGCECALAEDLTQETMLAVYRQIRQLRNPGLFRAWIFQIARNALLQHNRKRDRAVETTELIDAAAPPSDPLGAAQLAQWLAILSPDEREATLLRYVEGLEYHEIATVLGIPLGTAQWRVFESKKRLTARFGPTR